MSIPEIQDIKHGRAGIAISVLFDPDQPDQANIHVHTQPGAPIPIDYLIQLFIVVLQGYAEETGQEEELDGLARFIVEALQALTQENARKEQR